MLDKRLGHRAAKIRYSFVRRREDDDRATPLARMLRGGQGGEVRLKLFLSLLWLAGGGDKRHETRPYPARSWAALFDLPDPEMRGLRRILDASRWLEREGFVITEREPGKSKMFRLRLEDGSGESYFDPAEHAHKKKEGGTGVGREDLYISLPASFWTEGWIMTLSARAIAMLLILAAETGGSSKSKTVAPALARARYAISEDTWGKGVAELREHGIIDVRKEWIPPIDFEDFADFNDIVRVRNRYTVPRSGRHLRLPDGPFKVADSQVADSAAGDGSEGAA